jgi:RHS repeat-associated protein
MNDGSGMKYLLTDHLGSVVAVTNASGAVTQTNRYLPFGQVRADVSTPITSTDFGYTGQRANSYINLDDYKFRWLDPQLARFVSPDDIIPDLTNPQTFNRYSYVGNSPIVRNDPSGHCDTVITFIACAIVVVGALTAAWDMRRRHDSSGYCTDTLAECFHENGIKQFGDHQQIDQAQFNDLLDSVSSDLKGSIRTGFDPSRSRYDTPFYTGNSDAPGVPAKHTDETVCIGNKCSLQSSVNYFAQGMYSADTGESLKNGENWVYDWKTIVHGHEPSADDYYWYEYGYNYFKKHQQESSSQNVAIIHGSSHGANEQ